MVLPVLDIVDSSCDDRALFTLVPHFPSHQLDNEITGRMKEPFRKKAEASSMDLSVWTTGASLSRLILGKIHQISNLTGRIVV